MKALFVSVATALIFLCFTTPPNPEEELVWSPWRRLSWEDFTKRTGPKQLYKAFTYSGIRYTIEVKDGKADIKCIPYFLSSESWVHSEHMTPELLVHEQGHFDITALYAMRMQSEMNRFQVEIAAFKENNYQDSIEVMFNSIYDEMEARQKAYDQATNHGLEKELQLEWNRKVSFDIDSLMMAGMMVKQ